MPEYLPDRKTYERFLLNSFWALERKYKEVFYKADDSFLDLLFNAMCHYSRLYVSLNGIPILPMQGLRSLESRLRDVSL